MTDADIHFYFDPVCPFAWMTSKWVRMVAAQRDYDVDWRACPPGWPRRSTIRAGTMRSASRATKRSR